MTTISVLPSDLRTHLGQFLCIEERVNSAAVCSKTLNEYFCISSPNKVQILYMTIRWGHVYDKGYERAKQLHAITTCIQILAFVLWLFVPCLVFLVLLDFGPRDSCPRQAEL